MDRDLQPDDDRPAPPPAEIPKEMERPAGAVEREPIPNRERNAIPGLTRDYRLSADERNAIIDLAKFRVAEDVDLARHRYGGREANTRQDIRSLIAQGLAERKTVWVSHHREKRAFVALTKEGRALAKREAFCDPKQTLYSGFVKRAEILHDAAIYRMYQKEEAQLLKVGAQVTRVVLDFELKKKVYSPLIKAKALPEADYERRQQEIATDNHLTVVNQHIVLPDLRIEYVDRDGQSTRVDLELASEHYHGSHAAEKAQAGFRIYADSATADRLAAAMEEREITAVILSL